MEKEFKCIEIDISYKVVSKNSEVTVKRNARVDFGTETDFAQIADFLENAKKVIQCYKHCVKNGIFCRVYLSSAIYDRADGPERLKSRSFKGWRYEDIPDEADLNSLYFSPDPMYTDEGHDIYIDLSKSLLTQLAEAHI